MSVSSDDADTIIPSQNFLNQSDSSSEGSHSLVAADFVESTSIDSNSSAVILDKFSKFLCTFSYDEARALLEKHASQKNADPLWNSLLQAATNITVTEKQYMNLSFLAPKGFLRKECNLKGSLDHLRQDLRKFSDSEYSNYAAELLFLISVRMDLMDFYDKLSLLGTAKNVEIDDLISDYELITEKFKDRKQVVSEIRLGLPHLFTMIGWEIEILEHLLKAHSSMQSWDFFSSVISNQDAEKRLTEWAEFLQLVQNSKKSSFLNSGTVNPSLYTWLVKLRATLLSKFSLYFYDILVQYSNPAFDIKLVSAKLQTDYFNKITSFVKKSDALCVCLVLDARDIPYHPNGYSFPSRIKESPTGLNSFPAILAVPSKPGSHWPSVVMLINDRFAELNSDKLVGFFDTQVQTTYFLHKIDMRMYMLAIYESKKSEKDSYVVKFMQEMFVDLKCGKIFATLRTVAK